MGSIVVESPVTYTYRPLENPSHQIRLLKYKGISHDLTSARLSFEFITVPCPSSPKDVVEPFYAVSYSWGNNTESKEILLDDREIDVPYSTEEALRGLIKAFKSGARDAIIPIWIDAICINQSDDAEKGEQVPLMKRIYTCATEVCVWLGPTGMQTYSALQTLSILKEEKEAWFLEHGEDAKPPNGILATPAGCNWEALNTILAVPWFTRVWTIQEIVLARKANVFLGRYTFSWDDFTIAAQWAWDTHRDLIKPSEIKSKRFFPVVMMMKIIMRVKTEDGVALSRLLIATISRNVTKQGDRVYGMLGMRRQQDIDRCSIVTSYKGPLSEKYMAAAATIMETENSLLLLEQMAILSRIGYSVRILPSGEEPWPTWVPRLDIEDKSWGDTGLTSPVTGVQPSNAHNHIRAPTIKCTRSASLLHLRGIQIGKVEMTFAPLIKNKFLTTRVENNDWNTTDVARHFSYLWDPPFIPVDHSRETIASLADSLTIGGYEGLEPKMIADFGALMSTGWQLLSESDRSTLVRPEFTQEGRGGSIRDFVENVAGRAAHFKHLKISEGRFGMGYDNVRPGDIVVILLGVCVPMIMRREGDSGHYQLLGAVYVSGIMRGEYIQSLSEEERVARTRTFDIC